MPAWPFSLRQKWSSEMILWFPQRTVRITFPRRRRVTIATCTHAPSRQTDNKMQFQRRCSCKSTSRWINTLNEIGMRFVDPRTGLLRNIFFLAQIAFIRAVLHESLSPTAKLPASHRCLRAFTLSCFLLCLFVSVYTNIKTRCGCQT